MTDLVPADSIEQIVGVRRDPFLHIARAIPADLAPSSQDPSKGTIYLMHPTNCPMRLLNRPLTECRFSHALDVPFPEEHLPYDEPVVVLVGHRGQLIPSTTSVPVVPIV